MPPLKYLPALFLMSCLAVTASAKDRELTKAPLSRTGQVNLGLAQSYYDANDLETALDRATQSLRTDPKSADVHAMLGLIYNRISQPAKANAEFKRALELAPNDGAILNIDGVRLCEQGQADAADAQFTRALQDPFYTETDQALFNAGKCAYQAGQLPKAETYLRASLAKTPDKPEILMALAQVEFAKGDYMNARAFIQRRDALGASPEVLDLAARIEDAAGDPRAAANYRQRLHDEFSKSTLPTGEGANRP